MHHILEATSILQELLRSRTMNVMMQSDVLIPPLSTSTYFVSKKQEVQSTGKKYSGATTHQKIPSVMSLVTVVTLFFANCIFLGAVNHILQLTSVSEHLQTFFWHMRNLSIPKFSGVIIEDIGRPVHLIELLLWLIHKFMFTQTRKVFCAWIGMNLTRPVVRKLTN